MIRTLACLPCSPAPTRPPRVTATEGRGTRADLVLGSKASFSRGSLPAVLHPTSEQGYERAEKPS